MNPCKVVALLLVILACNFCLAQQRGGKSPPAPEMAPLYHLSFKQGEPVGGVAASPVIFLPFECMGDGTVFINMAQPPDFMTTLLTSVSPSGEAHVFRMEQASGLYDVRKIAHYASDASVIFLVEAASEDKPGKLTMASPNGEKAEKTYNVAQRRLFVVVFDREGRYQREIELEDHFRIQQIGAFQSGTFLAFGSDEISHAPRLALLNDDGTLLKYLQIEDGDAPESASGARDAGGKDQPVEIKATQFVPAGRSIIVVQSKSKYPLLEVSEAGAIRTIRPRLGDDEMINTLIPSDKGLYARISGSHSQEPIYEISPEDGSILRRFDTDSSTNSADVACVHDRNFLSFQHGEGKLIPLIGTPAPDN